MRVIYNIARTELQLLFYSPVAWLILVAFSIQAGILFTNNIVGLAEAQEMGRVVSGMTGSIFANSFGGVFVAVQSYLYMYIPLLTMSLISRELSSKSIQLLYSSPITNYQIIMGKFLSMMIYGLIVMGILFLMVVCSWSVVKDFNIGMILVGLLGLYLLLCAYAVIGIFMSSLTSYQIVAAIGTFAVLMLLNMIGRWWQEYDIIRDITYWLAISGRSGQFIRGLVCSEDVLYFVIVICLFLALTIIRLNAIRQKIPFAVTLGKNVGVIFIVCFLGYITSLPIMKVYYDATTTKVNTLTPNSQELIAQLEGGLTITTYVNALENGASVYASYLFLKPDMDRFEQYLRFKPEIKLEYVYYYDTTKNSRWDTKFAGKTLHEKFLGVCEICEMDSNRFIGPEEIRKRVDLSEEGNTFVRQIVRENGEKTWLRIYNDMLRYPSEREISAAFKRMLMKLPKVGMLQGHGERDFRTSREHGYSLFANDKHFRQSLMNQGFDVEEVRLDTFIRQDIDVLVIADMRKWLTPQEEIYLQQYIDRGGNLFILGEPDRREIMAPLFAQFGFKMTPGVLVKPDPNNPADLIMANATQEAVNISYEFDYKRILWLTFPSVAGLEQIENKGYTVTPLFHTSEYAWNELETKDFVFDTVRLNPEIGEKKQMYNTVVALSRSVDGKEQKIILSGDADCISNGGFGQRVIGYPAPTNYTLIMGSFFWFSNNEVPIDVRRPPLPDNKIYIGKEGASAISWMFKIILPALLALLGIFIWIRRKAR